MEDPFTKVNSRIAPIARARRVSYEIDSSEVVLAALVVGVTLLSVGGLLVALGAALTGLLMALVAVLIIAASFVAAAAPPFMSMLERRLGARFARKVKFDASTLSMSTIVSAFTFSRNPGFSTSKLLPLILRAGNESNRIIAERVIKAMSSSEGGERVLQMCSSLGSRVVLLREDDIPFEYFAEAASILDELRFSALLALTHIEAAATWHANHSRLSIAKTVIESAYQLTAMSDSQVGTAVSFLRNAWSGSSSDLLEVARQVST